LRFLLLSLLSAICALTATGCVEFEPASGAPVKGRAYFLRHVASASTDLWVCDASNGRPVCYAAGPAPSVAMTSY
jgi:hypothetical protein